MKNQALELFLSQMAARLDLSPEEAEAVVAELRTHLYADYEERLASGCDVRRAARESISEVGDALNLAREFRRGVSLHDRRPALRTAAALALAVYGFFGVYAFNDYQVLMHASERLLARNPMGVLLISGWAGRLYLAFAWLREHSQVEYFVCALPLLAVVGMLVGYVARRRGWLPAIVPAFLFWLVTWLAVAHGIFPFMTHNHVVEPLGQFLALALGAWAGERFFRARSRARRFLLGGVISVFALVCLAGLAQFSDGLFVSGLAIGVFAVVVGLAGACAVWLGRRLRSALSPTAT